MYDLERDIDEEVGSYFKAIGIEVPLPLQAVCFNFAPLKHLRVAGWSSLILEQGKLLSVLR
jgi:hypothetical protein